MDSESGTTSCVSKLYYTVEKEPFRRGKGMKNDVGSGMELPEQDRLSDYKDVVLNGHKGKSECREATCPTTYSYAPFLKPLGVFVLSKKNIHNEPMRDYIRTQCAAGVPINEDDIYYFFNNNRYRRSDCVRMLRTFHQSYPTHTRFEVIDGLWVLTPLPFQQGGE